MRAALTPDLLATDLAEYLVRKGVSFTSCGQRLARWENSLTDLHGLTDAFPNDASHLWLLRSIG